MENESRTPTPQEAATAIADAEAGRALLAAHIVVPPLFFPAVGVAVAVQIGTTAAGLAGAGGSPLSLVVAGLAIFLAVAAIELVRFRRLNGVWLGGMVSRVIGGTATTASTSYAAALAAALWAAFAGVWWLVPLSAAAGGAAYALSGRAWLRRYRSDPAAHGRGEPAVALGVCVVLALAGVVLLISIA